MWLFVAIHELEFWSAALLAGVVLVVARAWAAPLQQQRARLLALLAFALYFLLGLFQFRTTDFDTLVVITVRASLFGVFVLGAAGLFLQSVAHLHVTAVRPVTRRWIKYRCDVQERRRSQAEQRRRAEAERRQRQQWAADAPQREQERQAAAERQQAEAAAGLRRERAREACELLYSLHGPDIAGRFNREEMERFFRTYMNESQPPEDVERRGRELQAVIAAHRQLTPPHPKQSTVADLSMWYLAQRQRIDELPLDDELKQVHFAQLDARYLELSESLLSRAQP